MRLRPAPLAAIVIVLAACGDAAGTGGQSDDSLARPEATTTTTGPTTAVGSTPSTADGTADESPPLPDETLPEPPIPPAIEVVEVVGELVSGQMQLSVVATPETVDDVVPSVARNGVDVFGTNCTRDANRLVLSEVVYQCSDLELAVYDVFAAPVGGVEPELWCSPVGSFIGWDPLVADVGVDGFVYCTLSAYPPGVRVELSGVWSEDVTSVEIRDADGVVVDAGCRRVDDPESRSPGLVRLHCDPLPLGRYEIPRQDVDGTDVEQPFVCLPGLGSGNGPDFDNTFELEDRVDEAFGEMSVWTCTNDEPQGALTGLLMIAVEADPAVADELRVEVRRDGADIFGEACGTAVAPGYLDRGTDGFRFYECRGDWWGELTPTIANPPEGTAVTVFCFEQNPVTGVTGPTAFLDAEIAEPWICSVDVGPPDASG